MSRRAPLAWVLFAAGLFAAATPLSKLLLEGMAPLRLAGVLYLGAALAVAPWLRRGGSPTARWTGRNVRRLAGVVLFGGVAGPVLLLFGLQRAPASSVALWLSLETVATALFARLFFREHVGPRAWVAALVITGASVALASPSGFELGVPALLVGAACACWGLDNNFSSVVDGFTPVQSTFLKGAVAGATNLALSLVIEGGGFDAASLLGALALGGLAYGLSLVLYVAGAQQLGATRSQMIFSTSPLFGAALAWAMLGEAPTLVHAGAALAIGAALVWLHRERHEHAHRHAAMVHTHWHRHDDGHHDHVHEGLSPRTWHQHEHAHDAKTHAHPHDADLHHRHEHG